MYSCFTDALYHLSTKAGQHNEENDEEDLGIESQDEDDEGYGKIVGGGFTSAVGASLCALVERVT